MRGGYRPGGGRPKGSRDKKPRKRPEGAPPATPAWKKQPPLDPDSKERIRKHLEAAMRVKAKAYNSLVDKLARGEALSALEMKNMAALERELVEQVGQGRGDECTPEEFLTRVLHGEKATLEQIRAAEVLLRGKGLVPGKKAEREERAKKAQDGKFAPAQPPLQRVK